VPSEKKVRIDKKYIEGFLFDLGIIVLGNKNDVELIKNEIMGHIPFNVYLRKNF